ncbi:MAG: nucleotidyltransferase domain-containing protein, partial [Bacteroidota bacterium]
AIQSLLANLSSPEIVAEINALIAHKATAAEDYVHEPSTRLVTFVAKELAKLQETQLPKREVLDTEPLNQFFRTIIFAET